MDREAWLLQSMSMGSERVGHDWVTELTGHAKFHLFIYTEVILLFFFQFLKWNLTILIFEYWKCQIIFPFLRKYLYIYPNHYFICIPGICYALKFHDQKTLVGYSPWGHKESDTTDWLPHQTILNIIQCKIFFNFIWAIFLHMNLIELQYLISKYLENFCMSFALFISI